MNAFDWWPAIVSASGGGGILGVIGTRVFDWGSGRRKAKVEVIQMEAEATDVITKAAVALVQPLRKEIETLTARVDLLEAEVKTNESKLKVALLYIRQLLRWISEHVPDGVPPLVPSDLGI